jgi:hypothetical protein
MVGFRVSDLKGHQGIQEIKGLKGVKGLKGLKESNGLKPYTRILIFISREATADVERKRQVINERGAYRSIDDSPAHEPTVVEHKEVGRHVVHLVPAREGADVKDGHGVGV